MSRIVSRLLLAAFASGCSFAPPYVRPPTGTPPVTYLEAGEWQAAAPGDEQPKGPWWSVFEDPKLDALEIQVSQSNQNLKAAYARLQQARAATRVARADLFPTLTVGSTVARGRTSINSASYIAGREPTGNNFNLEADLSYEVDLWGRVRNAVASARDEQQASAADFAALDLSLQAELASNYFMLRSQDSAVQLLDHTVADYQLALELTQRLYQGGAAAIADVAQAQSQLENARTQTADLRLQRAQSEHAIAVLVGRNPSALALPSDPLPLERSPPDPREALPSQLLERRPDVSAAERRVAAANARIGIARAAYFPTFSLTAMAGLDSTHAGDWISAPSRFWSAGPQGLLTVFDAGRHRAQSAEAIAAYDEQAADYRNVVLTAYQEVEDSLVALQQLKQESSSALAAVKATASALQQAENRYKAGLVTYLEVSINELASLQAQLSLVTIQRRRLQSSVLLFKALGGGFEASAGRT